MKDLNAASLADVHQWFKDYYGPNNATLLLAGDIDLATAKAKAMRYFGDIPRGRAITAPAAEPPVLTAPINQSFTGPVSTAQIARTWPVPGGRDPANFSLDAVSGLMTGIDGAPLFDKLVRQDKLFNNLSADNTTYRGVGEFTIYGSVRKGVDPNVAAKALDDAIAAFLRSTPSADALERYKATRIIPAVRNNETIEARGGLLMQANSVLGSPAKYKDDLMAYLALTPAKVMADARKWLGRPGYRGMIVPGPRMTAAGDESVAGAEVPDAPKTAVVAPQSGTRGPIPGVGEPQAARFPPVQHAKLATAFPSSTSSTTPSPSPPPNCRSTWAASTIPPVSPARSARCSRCWTKVRAAMTTIGSSSCANGPARRSTAARRTPIPASRSRRPAPVWTRRSTHDDADADPSRLSAGSAGGISAAGIVARHGRADQPRHFVGHGLHASARARDAARQGVAGAQRGRGRRHHPPRSGGGLPSLDSPRRGQAGHRLERAARHAPAEAERDAGPLERAGARPAPVALDPRPALVTGPPKIVLVDMPGQVQAFLGGGQLVDMPRSYEGVAPRLANIALGGEFTSRINMNLREDKHWTYGASGNFDVNDLGSSYQVEVQLQPDKVGPAIKEVQKELNAIVTDRPITQEEFDEAVANTLRKNVASFRFGGQVMAAAAMLQRNGWPDDFFSTFDARIRAVALRDANARCDSICSLPNGSGPSWAMPRRSARSWKDWACRSRW